jgi:hypothetical protein
MSSRIRCAIVGQGSVFWVRQNSRSTGDHSRAELSNRDTFNGQTPHLCHSDRLYKNIYKNLCSFRGNDGTLRLLREDNKNGLIRRGLEPKWELRFERHDTGATTKMARVVTGRGEIRASGRCTDHSPGLRTQIDDTNRVAPPGRPASLRLRRSAQVTRLRTRRRALARREASRLKRAHRRRRNAPLANRHEKSTWRRSARCLIRFFLILVGPE